MLNYFSDQQARADLASKSNLDNKRIEVTNTTTDTEGIVNLENLAQQGLGNEPLAVALHHYTDGVAMQIDNVGASNSVFVIKNAHNETWRPDKPADFVGTGSFIKLTEDTEYGRGDLLLVTKDANFNWTGDRQAILQNQRPANTTDAAFIIDCLYNNKYMLALASIGSIKLYFNWDSATSTITLQTPSGVTGGQIYDAVKGDLVLKAREAGKAVKITDARDSATKMVQMVNTCTTAARPTTNTVAGEQWFDTTLNKPIWRNAANNGWVDSAGTAV